MRSIVGVCLLVLGIFGSGLVTAPVSFAATCSFDQGSATVTVEVGDGESVVIARSGDAITLDGTPCENATIQNTDTIDVNARGTPAEITISLAGGGFGDIGFSLSLPSGSPTVRARGGSGDDHLVAGAQGINLDAGEAAADADVSIAGQAQIALEGHDGADTLSVAGGAGTGDPTTGSLAGGDGADHLIGAGGSDELSGGGGKDRLKGGGGDDVLGGGGGMDVATFSSAGQGVEVHLGKGTASGAGDDTLSAIENVVGSGAADTIHGTEGANRLVGGAGKDELFGRKGRDGLKGAKGNDLLSGQKGDDRVLGGRGKDQLDGGDGRDVCDGGPDPDAFVFCEVVRLD